MASNYYRYTGEEEKVFIEERRCVRSLSGLTFLTPDCYDDARQAEKLLALPTPPIWRIGPIAGDSLPAVETGPRRVFPRFGKRGGGREIAVRGSIQYPAAVKLK